MANISEGPFMLKNLLIQIYFFFNFQFIQVNLVFCHQQRFI